MLQYITSESVTCGHPDKICDQISDAILDACLEQDKFSRVACESVVANDNLIVAGEITTTAKVDYEKVARDVVRKIGYDSDEKFYNADKVKIINFIHSQSPDIAQWVDTGWAWDQWIMFGYASNETPNLMPLPIILAHRLAEKLEEVRQNWTLNYVYPDGKTQVTVIYDENWKPVWIDTILISTQHAKWADQDKLHEDMKNFVIKPIIESFSYKLEDVRKILTNPTWVFNVWWPVWDSWLTGRKIIVDSYGWIWRHGWWAFSWKDSTKVDRSAAYMARYLAKNIVASWICDKCEIQLSYAIWVVQPISLYVDCFWTEKIAKEKIIEAIRNNFDLSPAWIIAKLDLRKPVFAKTATYGHFWRDIFSWEKVDSKGIFEKLK